jgi:hypothetical protein
VLLNTAQVQLGLYRHNGMFVMCTPSLLMLDFDTEDKVGAVELLQRHVNALETVTGTRLRFEIFETDGGIHAFLTSHEASPHSDNTLALMLQLQSDKTYAGFTLFRGFCARLNPKITDPLDGHALRPAETVRSAIIARACYRGVCAIGSGRTLPYLRKLLEFKMDAIAALKRMYSASYRSFIERDSAIPVDTFIKRVVFEMKTLLARHGLSTASIEDASATDSADVIVGGIIGRSYYTNYEHVLAADDYKACRRVSPASVAELRRLLQKQVDRDAIHYLIPPPKLDQPLVDAPYKMVVGFDPERCMAFLVLGDILTIDWDFTDTMRTPEVTGLVVQFLENLELFNDEEDKAERDALKFRSKPLAFRMYETDNGIHAFCTSHAFPHSGSDATRIMMAMCCDPAYIAFTQLRGYSLRLTPKVTKRENGRYVLDADFARHQFVQRPLAVYKDGSNVIAAPGAVENQGLIDAVDMVYRIQRDILKIPKLEQRLQRRDPDVLHEIKEIASATYDALLANIALYPRRLRAAAKAIHRDCSAEVCPFVSWPASGPLAVPLSTQKVHPCGCGSEGAEEAVKGPSPHTAFLTWHRQRTLKSMPKW